MDWFTNRENGNVVFIKDVEDLSSLNKEQLEKYAIGDISKYDRMGADNMFGNPVQWGMFDKKSSLYNVLDQEYMNFNDLSKTFMSMNGYGLEISKEHVEITEHIKYFTEPSPGSSGGK